MSIVIPLMHYFVQVNKYCVYSTFNVKAVEGRCKVYVSALIGPL